MTSFDLAATVEAEHSLLPQQALAVPSMLSYKERALLHWAAREGCGAVGEVIDAGCYLGGSTLSLATGLSRSAKPGDSRRVHSYDLFMVGGERERVYFDADLPFEVGADIRPLFEANVAPVRSLVEVHPGDILHTAWSGEAIATLFVDIAKSWATHDHVITQFFPPLVPGSVVIQQDLVHWGHPWCALAMELLIDHFEYLGHVSFSSAVYRARHPVPVDDLPTDLLGRLSAEEALHLIDRCAERVGEPFAGFIRLAGARALMSFGDYAGARARVDEVRDNYDDDTVPYISEGFVLTQLIDELERTNSAPTASLLTRGRRAWRAWRCRDKGSNPDRDR